MMLSAPSPSLTGVPGSHHRASGGHYQASTSSRVARSNRRGAAQDRDVKPAANRGIETRNYRRTPWHGGTSVIGNGTKRRNTSRPREPLFNSDCLSPCRSVHSAKLTDNRANGRSPTLSNRGCFHNAPLLF